MPLLTLSPCPHVSEFSDPACPRTFALKNLLYYPHFVSVDFKAVIKVNTLLTDDVGPLGARGLGSAEQIHYLDPSPLTNQQSLSNT